MNTLRAAAVAFILVAHFNPALARGEDADPDVLIMRGLDLRRAGRSADALALFRRAYETAPSISDAWSGFAEPDADIRALAVALDSLLDDPETRKRMGHAGRISAGRFEAASVVPRIVDIFEEALLKRRASHIASR